MPAPAQPPTQLRPASNLLHMHAFSSCSQGWVPSDYKALKRKVAQLLTIKRERELASVRAGPAVGSAAAGLGGLPASVGREGGRPPPVRAPLPPPAVACRPPPAGPPPLALQGIDRRDSKNAENRRLVEAGLGKFAS